MLEKTRGIVLRSVKFGDTSLVTTIFTESEGVQSYLLKGVRKPRSGQSKAGLLQPGALLDLVIFHNPQKNLQHIREFQPACYLLSLQEDIVKNSILLFSIELLLRLLPEHAPHPALFTFAASYISSLDTTNRADCANFPVYFLVQCGRHMGYELHGNYTAQTPWPDPEAGSFVAEPAIAPVALQRDESLALDQISRATNTSQLCHTVLGSAGRMRLIDWYLSFLQFHTQHVGGIRSLPVLRAVLHAGD
jgi:DNA repair protein RecO (recombination protein O)